jgi:hypothetical protein
MLVQDIQNANELVCELKLSPSVRIVQFLFGAAIVFVDRISNLSVQIRRSWFSYNLISRNQ